MCASLVFISVDRKIVREYCEHGERAAKIEHWYSKCSKELFMEKHPDVVIHDFSSLRINGCSQTEVYNKFQKLSEELKAEKKAKQS